MVHGISSITLVFASFHPPLHRSIPIGTLYFDKTRLAEQWNSQPQTMALFERIRTVGKVGMEGVRLEQS